MNPSAPAAAVPQIQPIVLEAQPGSAQLPVVRIFLGTGPAQYRAERVFVFALQELRNPDRRYEVYRMSGLAGMPRTHDRFAIPDLAGRQGRAIYNEVSQLYFADPADLFDQPMDGHGYLSPSPGDTDVMLIDCERMAGCWNLEAARQARNAELVAAAASEPGRWGALDPMWHARDLEYRHGVSKLLHYATPHNQPWRPAPDRYAYQIHPHGEYFLSLEQTANEAGFELYSAARTSPGFADALAPASGVPASLPAHVLEFARALGAGNMGLFGNWQPADIAGMATQRCGIPQLREPQCPVFEAVAACDLDRMPTEDLPWMIDSLFRHSSRLVYVMANVRQDGSLANTLGGWRELLRRVARRYPGHCWQLDGRDATGTMRRFRADFPLRAKEAAGPPVTWVLLGTHAGDNAQLLAIADALGWPYRCIESRFERAAYRLNRWAGGRLSTRTVKGLTAPWPDLLVSAGRRCAPVAQWVKNQSHGKTRLIHVGRSRARLSVFDVVLTTPQYGIPLKENVVALPAPYVVPRELDSMQRELWERRFAALPRPWIALLVGGRTKPYVLDASLGAALGRMASETAIARGGSLLVSTSPRTPGAVAEALLAAIEAPHWSYRFGSGDDNPHGAFLALADSFIVTGDSVSMMTEACLTGRPAAVFPLPVERKSVRARLRHALARWAGVASDLPIGARVTQAQGWRARLYHHGVAAGLLRRERQIETVYTALGMQPLPEGLMHVPGLSPEMLAISRRRAATAICDLVTAEREIPG